ncbi:MAG: hypothetical protein FH748_10315 [Balneolaceae bacterium]|nr:hypothetical protein [Balneolaceae bacterium]
MQQLKLFLFCLSIVLLLSTNSYSQSKSQPEVAVQEIQDILDKYDIPGATAALVSRDQILWKGTFGNADIEKGIPVSEQTLFGIGSISKTFISLAALKAQKDGKLSITTPVSEVIPSLVIDNPWSDTHPVRLVHLLEHTSGFDEAHFSIFHQADATTSFSKVFRLTEESLKSRWKAGSYYAYNNLGAILAAYVIEEQVNKPFDEYVSEQILQPLQMTQAIYPPFDTTNTTLSRGYAGSDNTYTPYPNIPQWPAGGLFASIDGMSNFVRLFLNRGKIDSIQLLPASVITRMETPESSLSSKQGISYGYGKGLQGELINGYHFYGHDGSYGGFLSDFGYSTELGIGFVILLNNRDGNDALKEIKKELLNTYTSSKITIPDAVELTGNQLRSITGGYQPVSSPIQLIHPFMRLIDLQFIVENDGKILQKSTMGESQSLFHLGNNRFRKSNQPIATSVFVESDEGNQLWLTNEMAYQQIPSWWAYAQFLTALVSVLGVLFTLIVYLFWIPIRSIKQKNHQLSLLIYPWLGSVSFAGMIVAFSLLYDPTVQYSSGAVLFYIFGWLFLLTSLTGLIQSIKIFFRNAGKKSSRIKYPALLSSVSCSTVALYLFYWGIIGLSLWNY